MGDERNLNTLGKLRIHPSMVAYACNLSIRDAEAEKLSLVGGQPGLHGVCQSILDYRVRTFQQQQ